MKPVSLHYLPKSKAIRYFGRQRRGLEGSLDGASHLRLSLWEKNNEEIYRGKFCGPFVWLLAKPVITRSNTNTGQEGTSVHTMNGNGTHDRTIRAAEDNTRLRPFYHCDRVWLKAITVLTDRSSADNDALSADKETPPFMELGRFIVVSITARTGNVPKSVLSNIHAYNIIHYTMLQSQIRLIYN